MKKNFRTILLTIIAVLGVTIVVSAQSYSPGSEEDPLVTQKYLESRLEEIKELIGAAEEGENPVSTTTFVTVSMTPGQKMLGGDGTEIILRTGEATAIDNGSNGISDLTIGEDLMSGAVVGANHLLIVPRNDGRGITAVTDVWVMVKGPYEIITAEQLL